MYESALVAFTIQLLEMSSITTPNQRILNIRERYIFSKSFFRKNIGDFTDLHNDKTSTWKFRVNRIVSVTGTSVHKRLPNFVNVAALVGTQNICLK